MQLLIRVILGAYLAIRVVPGFSQPPPPIAENTGGDGRIAVSAAAKSVGMSADRLQQITVEAEDHVRKGNLVGMVSLIARRGKIVYLEAAGHQNREKGVPMKTDTIFRIASFTKPVTSLAILMLYEEAALFKKL